MIKRILLCVTVCSLATGCAFTRTETEVHFWPVITDSLPAQKKAALLVGDFSDSRLEQDKYVLLPKANGYGQTTSGAYVTKEPVADILKAGLAEALQKNGFIGTNSTQYELHGDLQSFGGDIVQGLWRSTAKAEITVRFELVEKNSNRSVWHDTFKGQISEKIGTARANDFYAGLFSGTATELTKKLIADKTFRSFFE